MSLNYTICVLRPPAASVLPVSEAGAIMVPTKPRTRLKRPVPVVRSVTTRTVSTVTAAAVTPLRSWAIISTQPRHQEILRSWVHSDPPIPLRPL